MIFSMDYFQKLAYQLAEKYLRKIRKQKRIIAHSMSDHNGNELFSHRIVAHFVKCFDFIPYFWNERDGVKKSEDYKVFTFGTKEDASIACAILNSTTFYTFFLSYSDAYHCGRELILCFPCDIKSMSFETRKRLIELNCLLMEDFRTNSIQRRIEYHGTGWIKYDEFYPRQSKPIIDEIDSVLATIMVSRMRSWTSSSTTISNIAWAGMRK